MLTIGPLNDLPGVRHGFFTRAGGVSEGLYTSLNCGFGSGDTAENVAENRARALARVELEADRLVTLYQAHTHNVVVAEQPWPRDAAPRADGVVSKVQGLALGILTADCAPVLFADSTAGVVGAAHAGWRGALGGVLEATIAAMEALGASRSRIHAGVGPAIAQRSYEVGPEFRETFLADGDEHSDLFCPTPRAGHFHFDLKGFVGRRLAQAGLATVRCLPCDTCAEEGRFFSYRRSCLRGEPDYGRGLSLIFLEP
jgi:YfiH family protein